MKSYVIFSLVFLSSLGLTSCWLKNNTPQNADMKIGEGVENDLVQSEPIRHGQKVGKVRHFEKFVKKHGSIEAAFNAVIAHPNVIIDFYTNWCAPCKNLAKTLADIAPKKPSVLIVKIDIEAFPMIAEQFAVRSVPTLLFFKNGSMIKRINGFNKKDLVSTINDLF